MACTMEAETADPLRISLEEENCCFLDQLADFVAGLDPGTYQHVSGAYGGNGIGRQVRHILEHAFVLVYDESGVLDYEARDRDRTLENSAEAAARALRRASRELSAMIARRPLEESVLVAQAFESPSGWERSWTSSTFQRELMALSSHTVHHMALVAMLAAQHGVELDPDFGVAPSTKRYWEACKT